MPGPCLVVLVGKFGACRGQSFVGGSSYWKQALRISAQPTSSFLFLGFLCGKNITSQLPALAACCYTFLAIMDSPSRSVTLNKLFLL